MEPRSRGKPYGLAAPRPWVYELVVFLLFPAVARAGAVVRFTTATTPLTPCTRSATASTAAGSSTAPRR